MARSPVRRPLASSQSANMVARKPSQSGASKAAATTSRIASSSSTSTSRPTDQSKSSKRRVIQDSEDEEDEEQHDLDDDDDTFEEDSASKPRQGTVKAGRPSGQPGTAARQRLNINEEENRSDPDVSIRSDSSRVHKLAKGARGQMARRSLKIAAAFNAANNSQDAPVDVSSDSIRQSAPSAATASSGPGAATSSARQPATSSARQPATSTHHQRLGVLARAGAGQGLLAAGARAGATGANTGGSASAMATAASLATAARLRVDNTSFEEWMKMATDNKINSSNTWSFALIDYFHDMSLLRSDSGDGSINFQKASCTLDGCVKVWTSRVDSVVVETGRLLSGLQNDSRQGRRDDDGNADEDGASDADAGEDLDGDDGDGEGGARNKSKKKRNKEVTLAKHFSQIKAKSFDLEFTVDPLFKKTSADFDEGGAGGLLMNHLGVDRHMRIVFDASDVVGVDAEDDEETTAAQADSEAARALREADCIDIGKLRSKLFNIPEEQVDERLPHLAAMLNRRFVCPSLRMFVFDREDKTSFAEFIYRAAEADAELDNQDDDIAVDIGLADGFEESPNFMDAGATYELDGQLGGQDEALFDHGNDDGQETAPGADLEDDLAGPRATDDEAPEVDAFADLDLAGADTYVMHHDQQADDFDAFDADADEDGDVNGHPSTASTFTRPDEQHIMMALNADLGGPQDGTGGDQDGVGDGGGRNLFDYFDQRFMKNWAGPEHWKVRKVMPSAGTAAAVATSSKDDAGAGTDKATRKPREAFSFTFSVEDAPDPKQLFATSSGRGAATITLPKSSYQGSNREQHLLPEDQHYNSKQLLRLFVKPKVILQLRRRGVVVHADDDLMGLGAADGSEHIDEAFWAQQAADRDQEARNMDNYDDYDEGAMPFEDGDEMALDIGADDGAAEYDLVRRTKPEMVNYAKKATRVDIRQLKENIWKELGIGADGSQLGQEAHDPDSSITAPSPAPSGKRFAQVLGGLRSNYAKEKMDEISTSFCFICLLHLANEEGLQISLGKDSNDTTAQGAVLRSTAEDDALGGEDSDHDDDEEATGSDEDRDVFEREKDVLDVERARRDWEREMRRVGDLQQLLIVKDPTAGRSA